MASGDKLYTVNDDNTLKVLVDDGTNGKALVKAFGESAEDRLNFSPTINTAYIYKTGLYIDIDHSEYIDNSIYWWVPMVLRTKKRPTNPSDPVEELRLGFDNDGPYYWWTGDYSKKYITTFKKDNSNDLIIRSTNITNDPQLDLNVVCWLPLLAPSSEQPNRLLTFNTNNTTSLMGFNNNTQLLLQRRGYELINNKDIHYPVWAVTLGTKYQTNTQLWDYFNWQSQTSSSDIRYSANSKYIVGGEITNFPNERPSNIPQAWIAPTSYWANNQYKIVDPFQKVVMTDDNGEILTNNNGALSEAPAKPAQIPNAYPNAYVAVLKSDHLGYTPEAGFWVNNTQVVTNDSNGVSTSSGENFGLTVATNSAINYRPYKTVSIYNKADTSIRFNGGVIINSDETKEASLTNSGTATYLISGWSNDVEPTSIDLTQDRDTGRLLRVTRLSGPKEILSHYMASDVTEWETPDWIWAPSSAVDANPTRDNWVSDYSGIEVTADSTLGYAKVKIKITKSVGPSMTVTVNYDGVWYLHVYKQF